MISVPPRQGPGDFRSGGSQALGDHVQRSFIASVALSLAIAAAVVPATFATDAGVTGTAAPSEPAPTMAPSEPAPSATPAPTDDGTPPDGDISVDPTFIAPTPTPAGAVLGATGRPDTTLPPTDSVTAPARAGSATLQALLIALAAAATVVLAAGLMRDARRR